MAWRRRDRRGRPRSPNAKRRQATLAGRLSDPDTGTSELRYRKLRITGGRVDLELGAGSVLFAHEHLDRQQFDTLGLITQILQRVGRAWGQHDASGSITGLWHAITGAMIHTGFAPIPVGVGGFGLGDSARRELHRLCRELDGSRDLVIALAEGRVPPLVVHVLERRLAHEDKAALDRLRHGLDRIAGRRR